MSLPLRRLVTGAQARFVQDGIDLDLAYITDRIIVMAFPSIGLPVLWRNDRRAVRQFLDDRHGDCWRVWNFRPKTEHGYDEDDFYGRVSRYPFPDHHPPPLSLIPMAVADMTAWLAEDPKNVVVIHCKAGKGRSGTMACCYLISLPKLPPPPQDPRNISKVHQKTGQRASRASYGSVDSYPNLTNAEREGDAEETSPGTLRHRASSLALQARKSMSSLRPVARKVSTASPPIGRDTQIRSAENSPTRRRPNGTTPQSSAHSNIGLGPPPALDLSVHLDAEDEGSMDRYFLRTPFPRGRDRAAEVPNAFRSPRSDHPDPNWIGKVEAALALHGTQRMKPRKSPSQFFSASQNALSMTSRRSPGSSVDLTNDYSRRPSESTTDIYIPQRPSQFLSQVSLSTQSNRATSTRSLAPSPLTLSRKGSQKLRSQKSSIALGLNAQGSTSVIALTPSLPSTQIARAASSQSRYDRLRISSEIASSSSSTTGIDVEQREFGEYTPLGVSIASQRRWIGYWARMLAQQDARASFDFLHPGKTSRLIRILRVSVLQDIKVSKESEANASQTSDGALPSPRLKKAARSIGKLNTFKVFVGRYDDQLVSRLEAFERGARRRARAYGFCSPGARSPDLPYVSSARTPNLHEAPPCVPGEDNWQKMHAGHRPTSLEWRACGEWNSAEAAKRRLAQHGNEEGVGQWGFDVVAEAEKARQFNWPDVEEKVEGGRKFSFLNWFAKLKESRGEVANDLDAEEEEEGVSSAVWHHFRLDSGDTARSSAAKDASHAKTSPSVGGTTSSGKTDSENPSRGLLVSPDREICFRVQSRNKALNALLPSIASSAGWAWFIPAFEEPTRYHQGSQTAVRAMRRGDRTTLRFAREEIDFAKKLTGLMGLEVEWEWVETGEDEEEEEEEEEEEVEGFEEDVAVKWRP